jgi:hypothetical protein
MALTNTFKISEGLLVSNAYIRVNSVTIVREEPTGATVNVYTDSQSTEQPIKSLCYRFNYDINGANAVEQAYLHLKTLPEFADATDC